DPVLGIVHQERGAPGTHHRRHLAQDSPGRLVQANRVAEDLADGIDQVDLLVALGQLGSDLRGIALGGEHGTDDLGELLNHSRTCPRGRRLADCPVRDLQRPPVHLGDRHQPCRRVGGVGCPGLAEAQPRPGEPLEQREQPLDAGHPARSVRHTELPFSLNATWSTRCRSTNSPRPSSHSRRSGLVGSGTSAGLKPFPSSVTCSRTASRPTSTRIWTRRSGSWRLPYAIALARASASAVRKLNWMRRADRGPPGSSTAISSTAGPTYSSALGTASDNSVSPPAGRRTWRRSAVVTARK